VDLGLNRRRALVLGSSSGLGKAIATTLAGEGAAVVVAGRDPNRLAAAVADTGAAGSVAGDMAEEGVPERLVTEAVAILGGLNILVANTGGGVPGGLLDVTAEDEDAAYRRMLRPVLRLVRAAVPHLREGGDGRIVILAARSILEASPDLALSSVFRSGVAAAARSLAIELAPQVLVNVVAAGQFDTPALERFQRGSAAIEGEPLAVIRRRHRDAIPLGRFGEATELASVVAFLAGAGASYVTGTVVRVDGGAVRGF
jgi:NAD(P)-dependent dehydrogenase (short-subunit alcohol dehydrogenase family)